MHSVIEAQVEVLVHIVFPPESLMKSDSYSDSSMFCRDAVGQFHGGGVCTYRDLREIYRVRGDARLLVAKIFYIHKIMSDSEEPSPKRQKKENEEKPPPIPKIRQGPAYKTTSTSPLPETLSGRRGR